MTIFDLLKDVGIDDVGDVAEIATKLLGNNADASKVVKNAKTKQEKTQLLDIIGSLLAQDSKSGNIDFLNLAIQFLTSKDNNILKVALDVISKSSKMFPEQVAAILPKLLNIAGGNDNKEVRKLSAGAIANTLKVNGTPDAKTQKKIVTLSEKEKDTDIKKIYESLIKMFQ